LAWFTSYKVALPNKADNRADKQTAEPVGTENWHDASLADPSIHGLRDLDADRSTSRLLCHGNPAGIEAPHLAILGKQERDSLFNQQPRQFTLHCIADTAAVARRKAVEHEFFNVNL
jgi:hypothetical protein